MNQEMLKTKLANMLESANEADIALAGLLVETVRDNRFGYQLFTFKSITYAGMSNGSLAVCTALHHAAHNDALISAHFWAWESAQKGKHIIELDDMLCAMPNDMAWRIIHALPFFINENEVQYLSEKGKIQKSKIGKFIGKVCPEMAEKERHKLADKLKRLHGVKPATPLEFIGNGQPHLWQWVYRQAYEVYNLSSCMTDDDCYPAIEGYACKNLLPADKREKQARFKLAYLMDDDGEPYARAVVNCETMQYASHYCADAYSGALEKSLHAAGYRHSSSALDGCYIWAGEDGDRAPYLDGHHRAESVYIEGERFWRVCEGGEYILTTTSGFAPDCDSYCSCCEQRTNGELTAVQNWISNCYLFEIAEVCESCLRSDYTYLPQHGEYFQDIFIDTATNGDKLVTVGDYTDDYVCINDIWYHYDDVVYSDFYGDYIPSDESVFVDCLDLYVYDSDINHTQEHDGEYYYGFHDSALNEQVKCVDKHISQIPEEEEE